MSKSTLTALAIGAVLCGQLNDGLYPNMHGSKKKKPQFTDDELLEVRACKNKRDRKRLVAIIQQRHLFAKAKGEE